MRRSATSRRNVLIAGLLLAILLGTLSWMALSPKPQGGKELGATSPADETPALSIPSGDRPTSPTFPVTLPSSSSAFRLPAREIESRLIGNQTLSEAEIADSLRRLRFCRFIHRKPPAASTWGERARELCAGTNASADFDLAATGKALMTSDERTTVQLMRERDRMGPDNARTSAELILATSTDPSEIESALSMLVVMNQSLGARLTGRDMSHANQRKLESMAVDWLRCSLRSDCGPTSHETIAYCLHLSCSGNSNLASAYQETLPARDFAVVVQVASYIARPPERRIPPRRVSTTG